ncbi:MAG: hypothetical protein V1922_04380 [bacterium]
MSIEGLQIPRITTLGDCSGVHVPTRTNPEGVIFLKLQEMMKHETPFVSAGQHMLYTMPSLLPHHPDGSAVCWAAKRAPDGIERWRNPDSWISLTQDVEFLQAVEKTATHFVNGGNSMYFFIGWAPDNPDPEPGFTRRGGMTQIRHHAHIAPQLSPQLAQALLEVSPNMSIADRRILSIFLDYGSQVATAHIPHLRDFSSYSHGWAQHQGKVDRHMFGFLHLQDAIKQLVHLHMTLHGSWTHIARELYTRYKDNYLFSFENGDQSLLLFPPVVSASILFPSPHEKKIMGIADSHPCVVWASPFSPVSKTTLVDGVWLDRKSR